MAKFRLKVGACILLFLAIITSLPKFLRQEEFDLQAIAGGAFFSFILLFIFWVVHSLFIGSGIKDWWLKATLSILVGTLISLFYQAALSYFLDDALVRFFPLAAIAKKPMAVFRGLLLSGFVYFIVYYLHVSFEKQKVQLELAKLKEDNLEARLLLLKQQISPHFLFNSLSTLKTMTHDELSKKYILQLAHVYRYLLSYKDEDLVILRDELEFTNSYLFILKERFEKALVVNENLKEAMLSRKIPPLTLQILVENAVKHNVISESEPLVIDIYTEEDFLVVKNNLQLKQSKEEGTGQGLQNIVDRYTLLMNKEIEIQLNDDFFIVKVPLQ